LHFQLTFVDILTQDLFDALRSANLNFLLHKLIQPTVYDSPGCLEQKWGVDGKESEHPAPEVFLQGHDEALQL
jgi:hypothetical protein